MITETISAATGRSARATLFFAGWGMDAQPFLACLPADRDCVVCYNYTNLDFDPECLRPYDEVLVVAWSLGVWAAAQTMSRHPLPHSRAVAVNGTMCPISDTMGIPGSVFRGTLEGLTPSSLAKFRRRMCGSSEEYAAFSSNPPQRDFADIHGELRAIADAAVAAAPAMRWDCAIVGQADRIFPPVNQARAWEGAPLVVVPDGHCLASWKNVLEDGIVA